MEDLEAVYDAEISPLMARILEICKERSLPMFATFQLNDGEEDGEPLMCTSYILPTGCTESLGELRRLVEGPGLMAFTITTRKEGN